MDDYKSNSHKSKAQQPEPEKKIEAVAKAKTKKKSGLSKFADVFVSEDVENVKSYIFMEVLVPSLKKAISDIVTNGIDMVLYGETGHTSKKSTASKVSYRSYYDDRDRSSSRRDYHSRAKTGYEYDDIVIEDRGEAEEVLSRMDELVDTYGTVSVADLYDLVGITGSYTDNKYGWTDNIHAAKPVRVKDGWMLKLPRALPLD